MAGVGGPVAVGVGSLFAAALVYGQESRPGRPTWPVGHSAIPGRPRGFVPSVRPRHLPSVTPSLGPQIFDLALRELCVGARDAWHVGDSLASDVAGARNAGLAGAVWLNRADHPGKDGRRRAEELDSADHHDSVDQPDKAGRLDRA